MSSPNGDGGKAFVRDAFVSWLRSLPPNTTAAIAALYPDSPPGGEWVDEADLARRGPPLLLAKLTPADVLALLAEYGELPPPGLYPPRLEGPS